MLVAILVHITEQNAVIPSIYLASCKRNEATNSAFEEALKKAHLVCTRIENIFEQCTVQFLGVLDGCKSDLFLAKIQRMK